jgi:prevent-host-death family protein
MKRSWDYGLNVRHSALDNDLVFYGRKTMQEWNLAEARNRFSELVNRALTQGPQRVHRRKDCVVVVSAEEFERLAGQRPKLKDYLSAGESFEELNLERDPDPQSLSLD